MSDYLCLPFHRNVKQGIPGMPSRRIQFFPKVIKFEFSSVKFAT